MGIQEIWKDGELIETIETDDEITIPETEIVITQNAIENLQTTLADPAINSIAKVKTALINFFDEVKEAN